MGEVAIKSNLNMALQRCGSLRLTPHVHNRAHKNNASHGTPPTPTPTPKEWKWPGPLLFWAT